jgi:hypothetical protein
MRVLDLDFYGQLTLFKKLTLFQTPIAQSFSPNSAKDGQQTCRPARTELVLAGRQVCRPSRAKLGLKDWANADKFVGALIAKFVLKTGLLCSSQRSCLAKGLFTRNTNFELCDRFCVVQPKLKPFNLSCATEFSVSCKLPNKINTLEPILILLNLQLPTYNASVAVG